ncbi:reverse transcriptase family protein [Photobacterium iliopiscarium]|uniref:reverse transcriptase family protein n=1 Tax=Photobacterium iliopiscarium TaxID=56192 RepID=UPI0005D32B20|nr:reverse transcriptase family protein [Photobacterium iliopiscarium]KJG11967.1 reverse transcriptase [Photobacterium iliopiscarium]PST96827.1 RNA-directed DNA polymerase [Photobacterium iliopiscarium]PSV79025.1 RNA-directed DNA polymerase [Photobacterium iliopiscarium]
MDKPQYPCKSIASVEVLAKTLGVHLKLLNNIASKVEESYSSYVLPAHKVSGKIRTVFEPKHELKKIQKRINSRIFERVIFPEYLIGGIKATPTIPRDYVQNARIHSKSKTLINLDVRNFYPTIKAQEVKKIYKYFFKFSDEVVELLTLLTTYKGAVPQGGCTSSYLANLIFFNSEYQIVSSLRGQNIRYSRLLDDITISSTSEISSKKITVIIKSVSAMLKKHNLSLKGKKTKISDRDECHKDFEVTGLWVKEAEPKLRKEEVRRIRQLVYHCQLESINGMDSDEYHKIWNNVSGLVTKLTRLKHSQGKKYRDILTLILPIYNDYEINKLKKKINFALKIPKEDHYRIGVIKKYNQLNYKLGILGRTHKGMAKDARKRLKCHYSTIPKMDNYWEMDS